MVAIEALKEALWLESLVGGIGVSQKEKRKKKKTLTAPV